MINAKGEVIYTNAEIAYELGLSPATVNAIGRRLYD
nr:MAG TPA: replication initiator protein [Caudoviricetes sp.]